MPAHPPLPTAWNFPFQPDDGSHTLYVVQDHRARKKTVKVGLQTDSQVEVIGPELRDGDQVVTVGNRELADEMQVKY